MGTTTRHLVSDLSFQDLMKILLDVKPEEGHYMDGEGAKELF